MFSQDQNNKYPSNKKSINYNKSNDMLNKT